MFYSYYLRSIFASLMQSMVALLRKAKTCSMCPTLPYLLEENVDLAPFRRKITKL